MLLRRRRPQGGDKAAAVAVELAKAVVQGHDLLLRDYLPSL
jgi:hypothetical protein